MIATLTGVGEVFGIMVVSGIVLYGAALALRKAKDFFDWTGYE